MTFYEIDPAVEELARRRLHLPRAAADGRRARWWSGTRGSRSSTTRRRAEYDLLLVDAFAGDAIPTHLLTVEALRALRRRVCPRRGLLLLHVSNRYYDLRPVLAANARVLGLRGMVVSRADHLARDQDGAQYVALARRAETLAPLREDGWSPLMRTPAAGAWTDDRINVLEALFAP